MKNFFNILLLVLLLLTYIVVGIWVWHDAASPWEFFLSLVVTLIVPLIGTTLDVILKKYNGRWSGVIFWLSVFLGPSFVIFGMIVLTNLLPIKSIYIAIMIATFYAVSHVILEYAIQRTLNKKIRKRIMKDQDLQAFLKCEEVKNAEGLNEVLAAYTELWELLQNFRSAQGVEKVKCAVQIAHKLHKEDRRSYDIYPYARVKIWPHYSQEQFSCLTLIVAIADFQVWVGDQITYCSKEEYFTKKEYDEYMDLAEPYWASLYPHVEILEPLSNEEVEELLSNIR